MSAHVTDHKPSSSAAPIAAQHRALDPDSIVEQAPVAHPREFANLQQMSPRTLLYLQRKVGNHALANALHRNARQRGVQPKLMVGPADDRFEREADETAGHVMRMVAPIRREDDIAQPDSIQRAETEQADTRDGFAAGGDFQRQLRTGQGGGQTLPSPTRRFMESRFSASFDRVRVHADPGAHRLNDSIQAKAFTHGNHIFFNRNQFAPETNAGKRLLAHELTHVVQQGAAVQRMPTVQRTTAPVVQRGIKDWFKKKFSKKKTTTEETDKTDKTSTPTSKDVSEAKDPPVNESLQDSITYERRLGRYAFNHGKANAAAKTMVDKMTGAMVGEVDENSEEQQKKLVELYGRDKANSAGQVGANIKNVLGVLKEGNLRERLTALMNAMFGPFKTYVLQAMKDSAWGEMGDKGLNVEKLKRRKRQLRFNIGAKDIFRDPGNPLDRKKYGSYEYTGKTRFAQEKTSERTVGELEQGPFSIGLSEREKSLQFPGQKDEDLEDEKLKWMEGGTYWAVNHSNKWVKKIENSLHMPVIAGPSGSMLRMFQTWEYLNKPVSAEDWRLAVLAWMLSSNDHSFHEMMLTAADFGLPYTPGLQAYMDVAPLAVNELRQNVAVDGLFPHEIAVKRKVEGGQIKHLLTPEALKQGKRTVKGLDDDERGALSGPGAAAINLYTTFGYLILNPTRKGGMFAKKQVERNLSKKDELDEFKDDFESGKLTAKEMMDEAKDIIPLLDTALETLPDWKGDLFRGTGTFSPFSYRKNSTVKFGAYTSATLDEETAKGFADDFNIGPFKYVLHLETFAGKDVREISDYNEDEILIPPGSAFTVDNRVPPKSGRAYYHVYLKQTKRGGKGLKFNSDTAKVGVMDVDEDESTDTSLPTVIKDFVTTSTINVVDDKGYMDGEIDSGQTLGATGIIKNDLCQLVWGKKLVYLDKMWFKINFGVDYPLKGSEGTSSTTDAPVTVAKPSLTYFNAKGGTDPAGVLSHDQLDYINDETDKGDGWMEFSLLSDGSYYWCKSDDFDSFKNPPVVTTAPTLAEPSKGEVEAPQKTETAPVEPKQDTLQLYDSNDVAQDVLDDPSEIMSESGSAYTDDKMIEWIEIVTKSGMLYWVKKAEYEAFTG